MGKVKVEPKWVEEKVPLPWQIECLDQWLHRVKSKFLVCAAPGTGKTYMSGMIARSFLKQHENQYARVLVVVPTGEIRSQWNENSWNDHGLYFKIMNEPRERWADDPEASEMHGGVTTYQLLTAKPVLFRKLVASSPTLIIFDEIHHCEESESSEWGLAVKSVASEAVELLNLSGTVWRTSGVKIPFIEYDEQHFCVVANGHGYEYSRKVAQEEGHLRRLSFHDSEGEVVYAKGEEVVTARVNEEMAAAEEALHVRMLLRGYDGAVRKLLERADAKLTEIRALQPALPNAAGLVLAIDQDHAKSIGKVLEDITGEPPCILVSDSSIANIDDVQEFREGTQRWLVSVKMVTEGVDVKRLHVTSWLTTVSTYLSFLQGMGRNMRVDREHPDGERYRAYCYLLETPTLREFIQKFQEENGVPLIPSAEGEPVEPKGLGGQPFKRDTPQLLASDLLGETQIHDGIFYSEEQLTKIREVMVRYECTEAGAITILTERGEMPAAKRARRRRVDPNPRLVREAKTSKANKLVQQIGGTMLDGKHDSATYSALHVEFNRRFGKWNQDDLTDDELSEKIRLLEVRLKEERDKKRKRDQGRWQSGGMF